jgi:hypothetical protein
MYLAVLSECRDNWMLSSALTELFSGKLTRSRMRERERERRRKEKKRRAKDRKVQLTAKLEPPAINFGLAAERDVFPRGGVHVLAEVDELLHHDVVVCQGAQLEPFGAKIEEHSLGEVIQRRTSTGKRVSQTPQERLTVHSTPTEHSTQYAVNSTQYTAHSTQYKVQYAVHSTQ